MKFATRAENKDCLDEIVKTLDDGKWEGNLTLHRGSSWFEENQRRLNLLVHGIPPAIYP